MKDLIDFVNFGSINLSCKRSIELKELIDRPAGRFIIGSTLGGLARCIPSL
jgi:hypothetical protein